MEESGAKLYSKNFYTILKNKSMSIPTNFIEDISRRAPEKPKPPALSVSYQRHANKIVLPNGSPREISIC